MESKSIAQSNVVVESKNAAEPKGALESKVVVESVDERPQPRKDARPGYNLYFTIDERRPGPQDVESFLKRAVALKRATDPLEEGETRVVTIADLAIVSTDVARASSYTVWDPVLCKRRGSIQDPIGIDTEIRTQEAWVPTAPEPGGPPAKLEAPVVLESHLESPGPLLDQVTELKEVLRQIGIGTAKAVLGAGGPETVVAVIDSGFASADALNASGDGILDVEDAFFPPVTGARRFSETEAHGSQMVAVVHAVTMDGPPVKIRRIRIPDVDASSFLAPIDIAVAIATALQPSADGARPAADVILVAMSIGRWGTPRVLDHVLTEAARIGRKKKGAIIVCSSGRIDDNENTRFAKPSVALGADELGAHPDVLLVGPCDLEGRWLRRYGRRPHDVRPSLQAHGIRGKMGPSIAISAPGVFSLSGEGTVDDSSLASAMTAGVCALVIRANSDLTNHEIRYLLRKTAFTPPAIDTAGPEGGEHSACDRSGHNFKIGEGMVNALGAVLTARDPVCASMIFATPATAPPPREDVLISEPALLIARWVEFWLTDVVGASQLGEAYRKHRAALQRAFFYCLPLYEELSWIQRHLFAIFTYNGMHQWHSRVGMPQTHGALRRRILRAFKTAAVAVPDARDFLTDLGAAVLALDDLAFEHVLKSAFLGVGVTVPHQQLEAADAVIPYLWLSTTTSGD